MNIIIQKNIFLINEDSLEYLINKSMKGDISLKCKYPPIYSYVNKMDYRKNFNNY